EREGGGDFALVALLVLVDPDADRDLQAELGGDPGHKLDAAGRRIGAHGARIKTEQFEIGAYLRFGGTIPGVGMLRARVRRIGDTGQLAADARRGMLTLEQAP